MKKRISALILSLVLVLGLAGCASGDKSAAYDRNYSASVSTTTNNNYKTNDYEVYESANDNGGSRYFDLTVTTAVADSVETKDFYQQEIEWNTEEYKHIDENGWKSVNVSPFSTFAADVDTASYANLRRMINNGQRIPEDAVRIEELINYFNYDYAAPANNEPFSITTEMAPCPWNDKTQLLMVGIKAKDIDMRQRKASNLVFLVDVSGSMEGADRLGLVQSSFKMLTDELSQDDRISLVTYASGDRIVFEGLSGANKKEITEKVEDLFASGGTNGSAGIQTAYEIAEKYFIEGGNNRIILATDGDLNIGITDEGSLTRLITEKAKSGVFLSVLGFGWGNISDSRMEALADNGNGNYNYIDSLTEAKKVLVDEMGGTLFTVAKDVKFQLEFNPAQVKGYRLIGYENRTMAAEDFNDDKKDGGEIGAGHTVTALYEIALKDSEQEIPEVESKYSAKSDAEGTPETAGEYLTVNIRYKEPDGDTSTLITHPVDDSSVTSDMSENLSWAAGVAQAGMLIRKSEFAGTSDMNEVLERLSSLNSVKEDEYRKEFCELMKAVKIDR
ncbi:MAG: von Willebrand factor type A domain-containing protein [Lachnospiraceae bacterium]|nr:von Willebrand factor type A domain-containing protein [Lachnospiraceae bacterium]